MSKKSKDKYRLINAIMKINEVIVRDVNLSLIVNEFVEKFAKIHISSLIDFFSDYNQIDLIKECRDLTIFQTLIELLRMTRFSQDAMNSIAQFVWVVIKILTAHITARCRLFLDDVRVKKVKNIYENREVMSEIRLFVLKHIQWLNIVLINLELVECIISEKKSQFCMFDIKIINFVCDSNDRSSNNFKIIKIVEWSLCKNVNEARAFIEICVYYRIWILRFVLVAKLIYRLFRNEEFFVWEQKCYDIFWYELEVI